MPEQHIATIFTELHRIGVDPDAAAAPLVVTGFTHASLIEWLRGVPAGIGAEALDRRLATHARESLARAESAGSGVEDDPERFDPTPNTGMVRWWPTTVVLDAAIQLLAEEWDPIGFRLGSVPAEDLGEIALRVLWPLLHAWPFGDPRDQTITALAAAEASLGLRRSPEIHHRYLAARLRELIARSPLPVREPSPTGDWRPAIVADADEQTIPAHRDPRGVCTRCQTFGTVARVTTRSSPQRTEQFCARCWREVRSKYMSFERDATGNAAESRSWDDAVEFVRLVMHARSDPERGAEITDDLLSQLAAEIIADADAMDGPIPDEIEVFLREFAPTP